MGFGVLRQGLVQPGLKPVILLPQLPQSWDHKRRLAYPISDELLWFCDVQPAHSLLPVCDDRPEKKGRQKPEEDQHPLVWPITLSPSQTFTRVTYITFLLF